LGCQVSTQLVLMDVIDPWDAVLDVEASFYEQGAREGRAAALEDGIIHDGKRAGFMKGFAIGIEVGSLESAVRAVLVRDNDVDQHHEVYNVENDSETGQPTVFGTSRQLKRRTDFVKRCESLPLNNDSQLNYVEEVRQLRSMFRLCETGIKELVPKLEHLNARNVSEAEGKESSPQNEAAQAAVVSHEW
jgi:hypothetical protein